MAMTWLWVIAVRCVLRRTPLLVGRLCSGGKGTPAPVGTERLLHNSSGRTFSPAGRGQGNRIHVENRAQHASLSRGGRLRGVP
jgi:hypothetical protein